jgi:hypothetical protein
LCHKRLMPNPSLNTGPSTGRLARTLDDMKLPTKRTLLWGLALFFPITLAGVILIAKTVHSDVGWWAPVLWILLVPASLVASALDRIAQEYEWFMYFVVWPLSIGVQYAYCVALVLLVQKFHRTRDI